MKPRPSARASRTGSLLAALLAAFLAACESTTQMTSGERYLARSLTTTGAARPVGDLDRLVLEAAAIEPRLRFPARIGLARIENGRLIDIPASEGSVWIDLREKLGPGFGEFVPLNRVVAELAYAGAGSPVAGGAPLADTIARIRLGAARQHLDAVLIYEVAVRSETRSTGWTIIDWTLVGAYAPTRRSRAEARASALLIDVRNGYPYGEAHSADDSDRATAAFGGDDSRSRQRASVTARAVGGLAPEVEVMLNALREAMDLPPTRG